MQEMTMQELDAVGGALTTDQAGTTLVMIGVVAAGAAAAPFLAGFAMTVGLGLLIGNALYGSNP